MKLQIQIKIILLMLIFCLGTLSISGQCNPDSLDDITITGIVEVDTNGNKIHYSLDTDFDSIQDYTLNFGPYWYYPDDGEAKRPQDGDTITVKGGLKESAIGIIPVIIVYKINDLFWRNPFENFWNQYDNNYTADHSISDEGMMILELPDSIIMTTVTGVVMADTTVMHINYYLNIDGDGMVDYKLNFGPPWYEPEGDIDYPEDGETVTIYGGVTHVQVYPVLIVFEVNGEVWRDATLAGPNGKKGGKWITQNKASSTEITSTFDAMTLMKIPNRWLHGNVQRNMFFQLLQVNHQYLYRYQNEHAKVFAGFEIGCFTQNGENYMHRNQSRMHFYNPVKLQFHYTQKEMDMNGIRNTDRIRLHYWDQERNQWHEAGGAKVDYENQTVVFYTSKLYSCWILTGELLATDAVDISIVEPEIIIYPNPGKNNIVNLNFRIRNPMLSNIYIFDIRGLLVYHEDLGNVSGKFNKSINTSSWKKGLYYVAIYLDNTLVQKPLIILEN